MSDSRGLAIVDWDQDGDLDVWVSNRTSPRIRMLQNGLSTKQYSVAFRLRGTRVNRDAIGARLELHTKGRGLPSAPLIRTLRAGEGYLAQSSKWVHFGLGRGVQIERLVVSWPGGRDEVFQDLTVGSRYTITEGSDQARRLEPAARTIVLTGERQDIAEPQPTSSRIVPHRRLPLPRLTLIDRDARELSLPELARRPTLLVLWATWCQPCLAELADLVKHERELSQNGITVVTLCVDQIDKESADEDARANAFHLLDRLGVTWPSCIATSKSIDMLDAVQRVLVNRESPLPIPSSFLLDDAGRLAAVYKGVVSADRLLSDAQLRTRPDTDTRDHSVPFPGRWYVNPIPPDLMAIPRKLMEISLAQEALQYLDDHVLRHVNSRNAQALVAGLTAKQVANAYFQIGVALAKQQELAEAEKAFQQAVRLSAELLIVRVAWANLLEVQGRMSEAIDQYEAILRQQPDNPLVLNNVAWILATSIDDAIRDGDRAVELAEKVDRITKSKMPSTLDTLAAAYAAAGRFDEAIAAAEQGVTIARAAGRNDLANSIGPRLKLYRSRQPYRVDPNRNP